MKKIFPNSAPLDKMIKTVILCLSIVYLSNFLSNITVNSLRSSSHYTWNSRSISCPFSAEHFTNVTCFFKRINRTSENVGFDFYIKPDVQLNSVFVSICTIHNINMKYAYIRLKEIPMQFKLHLNL